MKTMLKKWFTLVELIVVITILVILSTIAFATFDGVKWKSKMISANSNLVQMSRSLEVFKQIYWFFPKASNDDWTKQANYWLVWKLSNKSSFATYIENSTLNDNWIYTIRWKEIFYAVDSFWEYYAIWNLADHLVGQKFIVKTNFPNSNVDEATLFDKVNWSNSEPTSNWAIVNNLMYSFNWVNWDTNVHFARWITEETIPANDWTLWWKAKLLINVPVDTKVIWANNTVYVKWPWLQY